MHVTLIRPSTITTAGAVGEDTAPPLGVGYLAAALSQAGHDVSVVDALGEGIDRYQRVPELSTGLLHGLSDAEILARIPANTKLIGVSAMFSLEWPFTRRMIELVHAAFPDAFIVGGGEHVTALPEFVLGDCQAMGACALGEGEQIIVDLADALDRNLPLSDVSGLCLRDGAGGFQRTLVRNRIRDLKSIPRPAWQLIPIENYLAAGAMTGVNFGRSMPILASRGCPYECTFCSNPVMWGRLWRARPPDDVLDEIEDYMHRYGAKNFDFYDLTAIVKRDWIISFCEKLLERRLNITWQLPSGTRSEALDDVVTKLLHRSGCKYINYAPESGSEATLQRIKKKVDKDKMIKSMRQAVRNGLNIKANMIMGFPDETLREMTQSYRFIMRMAAIGIHDISVFPFSPYPGSALFERVRQEGQVVLEDPYFYSLSQYTDIAHLKSYCQNVTARQLGFLCLCGMALFYAISMLTRPWRFFALLRDVYLMKPKTKLGDALTRIRKKRQRIKVSTLESKEARMS